MLVLIATDSTQRSAHALRGGAVDGELVAPVVVACSTPGCEECTNAWFGLVSHGPTATAMVVDRPGVTEADLRRRVHEWLDCRGVIDVVVEATELGGYSVDGHRIDDPVEAVAELVDDHVREIRLICASYPVGTVVSRLGSLVSAAHLADAA